MINVTKAFLPDFDEYTETLSRAWKNAWLTNNGELLVELEARLKQYLGVRNLLFTGNGTVVLQMALKALNITKEVITTPFSYVATTNAILWENCTPVFADIEPGTYCIDPEKIEACITKDTQAILATHVYGYPCDVDRIQSIAEKHDLSVIYDGAHAFGCIYKGKSLLNYGTISTCSFHATKIFHTVEGGGIFTGNDDLARKLTLYRSFGHIGDEYFSMGINGKNSEFHAAMGLCNLKRLPEIIEARKNISRWYDQALEGLAIQRPTIPADTIYNYSYYPVVFPSEQLLLKIMEALKKEQITARRYFYPSLNTLPFLNRKEACPIAENIAPRVLCLPLYFDLAKADVERISAIVRKAM